jgi:hypothetical protein
MRSNSRIYYIFTLLFIYKGRRLVVINCLSLLLKPLNAHPKWLVIFKTAFKSDYK